MLRHLTVLAANTRTTASGRSAAAARRPALDRSAVCQFSRPSLSQKYLTADAVSGAKTRNRKISKGFFKGAVRRGPWTNHIVRMNAAAIAALIVPHDLVTTAGRAATGLEHAHGHEGSRGNDGSLRADERSGRIGADLQPAAGFRRATRSCRSAAPRAIDGFREAMGRPVARRDGESPFTVAVHCFSSRSMDRSPPIGRELARFITRNSSAFEAGWQMEDG